MSYKGIYQSWLDNEFFDQQTRDELLSIKDNEAEIEDRFYQDLKFGTAGLRGKIGAGSNRMNKYTVSLATQGLADTIRSYGEDAMARGVAISHDVRHRSEEFSKVTASVLAANGIKVYIHKELTPTPVLSYTIRKLQTISGVMITASHNPKDYNGYKAYWEDGSQILDDIADQILENMAKVGDFSNVRNMDFEEGVEKGLIEWVDPSVTEDYIQDVLSLAIEDENIDKDMVMVYSALNGTGNVLINDILKRRGFTNVHNVKEQQQPDPDFTTVGYPNPEDPKAFAYAEKLGKEVGAKFLMATDPDADRLALEYMGEDGEYVFFNGNQIGSLLTYYILSRLEANGELPSNGAIVKSLVSSELPRAIAEDFGVASYDTLTGFKNIFAPANEWEKNGEHTFIFGYEESIGYNYGSFVRDKDAVSSAMMVAEMVAFYEKQGQSLFDVLEELYQKHGYHLDNLVSVVLEGADGKAQIGRIMDDYRQKPIQDINGNKLSKIIDYKEDDTGLDKSNVLKYIYEDGSWFVVRPSGTEPKIKLYIYSVADTRDEARQKIDEIYGVAYQKMMSVE